MIFLHGAGGTGAGALGMTDVVRAITARGYVVIAPDGLPRRGERGGGWSFLPAEHRPRRRDEAPFPREAVADAAMRFHVDPTRVTLSGFSAGAFLVSYLACDEPGAFAASAPIPGGLWVPQPEACRGPVRLLQTHGFTDGTAPLEGRILGGGYRQGDILAGMALCRGTDHCPRPDRSGFATIGQFQVRRWDCAPGSALAFAIFPGGHEVPQDWADMMLDWYAALPGAQSDVVTPPG